MTNNKLKSHIRNGVKTAGEVGRITGDAHIGYIIFNVTNKTVHTLAFMDPEECKKWIKDTLDLSLGWAFKKNMGWYDVG